MLAKSIQKLIDHFSRLPGIGPKTAERLVFYMIRRPKEELAQFAQAINELKEHIKICPQCFNVGEGESMNNLCEICANPKRDPSLILVVEKPIDIVALEKTAEFFGLYHVLGGALEPTKGVTPDRLKIRELEARVKSNKDVKEIILATNPTVEGEATAMYLSKVLKPYKVKVTRIARGLPAGADIEYADEVTLSRALEGRREY